MLIHPSLPLYKNIVTLRLNNGSRHTPGKQPLAYPYIYIPYIDLLVIFEMPFGALFELPHSFEMTLMIPFIEPWSFSVRCHLRWVQIMLTREFLFFIDSSIPHTPVLASGTSKQTIHRVRYTSKQPSARWSFPGWHRWRFSGGRQRWT